MARSGTDDGSTLPSVWGRGRTESELPRRDEGGLRPNTRYGLSGSHKSERISPQTLVLGPAPRGPRRVLPGEGPQQGGPGRLGPVPWSAADPRESLRSRGPATRPRPSRQPAPRSCGGDTAGANPQRGGSRVSPCPSSYSCSSAPAPGPGSCSRSRGCPRARPGLTCQGPAPAMAPAASSSLLAPRSCRRRHFSNSGSGRREPAPPAARPPARPRCRPAGRARCGRGGLRAPRKIRNRPGCGGGAGPPPRPLGNSLSGGDLQHVRRGRLPPPTGPTCSLRRR